VPVLNQAPLRFANREYLSNTLERTRADLKTKFSHPAGGWCWRFLADEADDECEATIGSRSMYQPTKTSRGTTICG